MSEKLNMSAETHPDRFSERTYAETEEEQHEGCLGCEELEAYRQAVTNLSQTVRDTQNALYEATQELRAWRKLADAQETIVELRGQEKAAGP